MHPNIPDKDLLRNQAIEERVRALAAMTSLLQECIVIPGTEVTLTILRPENIDSLLDHVMSDPEQNLPYWAEIWPSGIALAAELLLHPNRVGGVPVIELGCGIGITAAAALMSGAELTVIDYAPESLLLTEITCLLASQPLPRSSQMNWRDPQAVLLQDSGDLWPVVLAADVLYEERDIEPVLSVLDRMLAPGGQVLLAQPNRRPAVKALRIAEKRGWTIETRDHMGPWPDPGDANVIVSVHTMYRNQNSH